MYSFFKRATNTVRARASAHFSSFEDLDRAVSWHVFVASWSSLVAYALKSQFENRNTLQSMPLSTPSEDEKTSDMKEKNTGFSPNP